MAKNRDKPPIEDKTKALDSSNKIKQNEDHIALTEQTSEVREAVASITKETWRKEQEKRYRDLFGDIEVEAIVDKEYYERIFAQIKKRLLQDFSDLENKRNNLTFNEFKQEIRDQYSGNEEMLKFWDQQFSRMELDYQQEIDKWEIKSQKALERFNEELDRDPFSSGYIYPEQDKKRIDNKIGQLRASDPWAVACIRTFTNRDYYEEESSPEYLDGPTDSLYYIASFLKGELLDEQDLFEDIQETLKGKKILILGDDIGTVSGILRQYGAESYGVEIDKLKVAIAHSGILAKGQKPQTQVIEGNIGDIVKEEDTALFQRLKDLSPFDMVYSYRVFNHGSGLERELPFEQSAEIDTDPSKLIDLENFQTLMKRKFDALLNENGLQLHIGVNRNLEYLFPAEYSDRGDMWLTAVNKEDTAGEGDSFMLIPKKGRNSQE
ncbi:hypothetical protein KJ742_04355 [Patescibacteria group bacterium]|nr:hypothetical protein [Patescibacteria group bacterium]MBU1683150.1 hypothetical protein [Patescibacteria group bacterium]MBU1935004.1 hypothetical protein [Patescibacteria group bacterium]